MKEGQRQDEQFQLSAKLKKKQVNLYEKNKQGTQKQGIYHSSQ